MVRLHRIKGRNVYSEEASAGGRLTFYTARLSGSASETRTFEADFVNNPFVYVCDVRERLWHMNDLTPVIRAIREMLSLAATP